MNAQEIITRELNAGSLYDITAITDPAAKFAAMQIDNETRGRLKKELNLTTQQLNKLVNIELIKLRSKR